MLTGSTGNELLDELLDELEQRVNIIYSFRHIPSSLLVDLDVDVRDVLVLDEVQGVFCMVPPQKYSCTLELVDVVDVLHCPVFTTP